MSFASPRIKAALLAALMLLPALADAKTLKIATVVPAGTEFIERLRAASDTIEQRTNGRVAFKLFPGGTMGKDSAVLRKMKIGQLDGAVITASGLAKIHPDAQVYSMPFLFRNRDELDYVRERVDPLIRERLRSEGYVVGGISEGGFTNLFAKEPIRELADLDGRRVWIPEGDPISARMFKKSGAQPVSLPVSDVFTSLQSGMVDTVGINPAGAIALQWHTGVTYQTDAPLLFLIAMLVFDRQVFEGIDAADREVVHEALQSTMDDLDRINRENNREALQALREQGIELVEPTRPAGERNWKALADEALAKLEREGTVDLTLMSRVRELIAEYRDKQGD
jgi:TRAP-type C4-dicarboxylate transport system substrate-binding protein